MGDPYPNFCLRAFWGALEGSLTCLDHRQEPWPSPQKRELSAGSVGVVVKIKVPFWVPTIIRHLLFRVPKKGP